MHVSLAGKDMRLPFRDDLAGDMFQRKNRQLFIELPNMFGIVNDILILGYDDTTDHDKTPHKVLQI